MNIKMKRVLMLIALMLMTVFVFYPVLRSDFVNIDDRVMIVSNWKIQSFSQENLKALFLEPHYKLYHPLVNLSYAIEYRICRLEPYLYHADNLILHLFNTLFVFFIFFRLTKRNFTVSFITALIFACHPMHVEPVAWVSGRKDTLYAFFFLASWFMYLKAYACKGRKYALTVSASLFLFLCACLSKSMAVTLPVVLILCDWLTGKAFNKRSIMKYVPFVLVAAIFSFVTFLFYYTPGDKSEFTLYTLYVNFVAAHFNVLFYMVKFLVPVKLSVIYPNFFDASMPLPEYILRSPAMLYAIIVLILWSLKKTKKIAFGFALFLITILPVLNIFPAGVAPVSDRYTYIPFIGFGFILASGMWYAYNRINKDHLRSAAVAAVAACFIAMCISAQSRAEKWYTTKTLFDDVIKNYPADIAHAHSYAIRGNWFKEAGMNKEAEKDLMMALHFNKESGYAIYTLAVLLKDNGKYDEALDMFALLPEDDVNIANAYVHSANIYYEHKNDDKTAHEIVADALRFFPKSFFLHVTLGSFYSYEEKYEKAVESFEKAKNIYPHNKQSYINLGDVYEKTGKYDLAEKEYIEGIRRVGIDKELFNKLGELYFFRFKDYDSAEKTFKTSLESYPGNYRAYDILGSIYAMRQDYRKAFYYFTLAVMSNNSYADAYFHRAAAHLMNDNFVMAAEDAQKVKKYGGKLPEEFKEEIREKSGIIL